MSHKEILEKAIQKAISNGWDSFDCTEWWKAYYMYGHERLAVEFRPAADAIGLFYEWPVIVFNHDFAKALWGESPELTLLYEWGAGGEYKPYTIPAWQYHLQEMVIAEDAIAYLDENI